MEYSHRNGGHGVLLKVGGRKYDTGLGPSADLITVTVEVPKSSPLHPNELDRVK